MSVSNTVVKAIYDANGATTTFAVPFAFPTGLGSTYLKVYTYLETTGAATLKTITTHYTLTPTNANPTNVVFVTAPADGLKVVIIRVSALTQTLDYVDNVAFPASTHELAMDRIIFAIQELDEKMDRALKVNPLDESVLSPEMGVLNTPYSTLILNSAGTGFEEGPTSIALLAAEVSAVAAAAAAASSASGASTSAAQASASEVAAAASAAAALVSQLAAAVSLSAAQTAETNAETAETNAELAETNAETAETNADQAQINAEAAETGAQAAQAAAEVAQAAAEAAAASVVPPVIVGSRAAPTAVVAGTGITAPGTSATHLKYIEGSGGAVDISANPQIAAGLADGQRMILRGRSATNTVLLEDGTGLSLNGSYLMGLDSSLELMWDLTNWVEMGRNGL